MHRGWYLASLTLLGLMIAAAGCRQAGKTEGAKTTPSASAQPQKGDFKTFSSSKKGYSISYPSDWSVKEDFASIDSNYADAFLALEPKRGFTTTVNVLCEPLSSDMSSAEYLEDFLDSREKQLGVRPTLGETVEVDGETTNLIMYDAALRDRPYEVTQVIVVKDDCAWAITLTAGRRLRGELLPIFATMYESFRTS